MHGASCAGSVKRSHLISCSSVWWYITLTFLQSKLFGQQPLLHTLHRRNDVKHTRMMRFSIQKLWISSGYFSFRKFSMICRLSIFDTTCVNKLHTRNHAKWVLWISSWYPELYEDCFHKREELWHVVLQLRMFKYAIQMHAIRAGISCHTKGNVCRIVKRTESAWFRREEHQPWRGKSGFSNRVSVETDIEASRQPF